MIDEIINNGRWVETIKRTGVFMSKILISLGMLILGTFLSFAHASAETCQIHQPSQNKICASKTVQSEGSIVLEDLRFIDKFQRNYLFLNRKFNREAICNYFLPGSAVVSFKSTRGTTGVNLKRGRIHFTSNIHSNDNWYIQIYRLECSLN